MNGITASELVTELHIPDHCMAEFLEAIKTIATFGHVCGFEIVLKPKDGEPISVAPFVKPIKPERP